jgi:hypothetical protein
MRENVPASIIRLVEPQVSRPTPLVDRIAPGSAHIAAYSF